MPEANGGWAPQRQGGAARHGGDGSAAAHARCARAVPAAGAVTNDAPAMSPLHTIRCLARCGRSRHGRHHVLATAPGQVIEAVNNEEIRRLGRQHYLASTRTAGRQRQPPPETGAMKGNKELSFRPFPSGVDPVGSKPVACEGMWDTHETPSARCRILAPNAPISFSKLRREAP